VGRGDWTEGERGASQSTLREMHILSRRGVILSVRRGKVYFDKGKKEGKRRIFYRLNKKKEKKKKGKEGGTTQKRAIHN